MTPTEAIPGNTTGITDDITGVVHNTHTQPLTHITLAMTLCIADHLHIGALQLTPDAIHNIRGKTSVNILVSN